MLFADASVLVKRYVREAGSARAQTLLGSDQIAVCRLSALEVVSAFARLTREGSMSAATRFRLTRAYRDDLAAWHVVELTSNVADIGQDLLLRHPLRTGDAVQLASCLIVQRAMGAEFRALVVADSRLAAAATAEGLSVEVL